MFWKKRYYKTLKRLDQWDLPLIKLSLITFTLAMVTTFGILMTWTHKVDPLWYWGLFLLFAIRPTLKWLKK
ncbi:MAG: hypothetical protein KKF52_01120 [Nanoarchaeota archaeon]|nr:hypothetical protein [Nanoarchaeota archaeon]MBU4241809.1 hypothetical protein [Nanoarchaeota archaeon]MBU4352703.1 hypothetical protein [Nanoarchaeota archaeon]